MGLSIAIICEGSSDFNVMRLLVDAVVRKAGETVDKIDCLQPVISETYQVSGGGWHPVYAWCIRDNGDYYRNFLEAPLFATSVVYDLLIIHLDGDVVTHCECEPLAGKQVSDFAVTEVVSQIKNAVLEHWLNLDAGHKSRVVCCVPVQHIESWLSVVNGPAREDRELINIKSEFKSVGLRSFRGPERERYIKAAQASLPHIEKIASSCASFSIFKADLSHSASN